MIIPNLTTTRQIQTNYRAVFDQAKTDAPVVVMTNNQPDVMIISIPDAEYLLTKAAEAEMKDALQAVTAYKHAKKNRRLIRARSLAAFTK